MPKLFREKPSFFWEADKRRGNHVWQLHLDCLRIHLIHLPSDPSGKKLESYLHDHILKPLGVRTKKISRVTWEDNQFEIIC